MDTKIYHKSAKTGGNDSWETPPWLFHYLEKGFGKFNLDVAASDSNHLCDNYYTEKNSAFDNSWHGNVFCNPPYSLLRRFCKEAHRYKDSEEIEKIIFVIPARTDTQAWHRYIFNHAVDVWFLEGRLKFYLDGKEAPHPAGFPSAIVEWGEMRTAGTNCSVGTGYMEDYDYTGYNTITTETLLQAKEDYERLIRGQNEGELRGCFSLPLDQTDSSNYPY